MTLVSLGIGIGSGDIRVAAHVRPPPCVVPLFQYFYFCRRSGVGGAAYWVTMTMSFNVNVF